MSDLDLLYSDIEEDLRASVRELLEDRSDPDAVTRWLEDHRIPADARDRRLRMDRERVADVPVWVFSAEDLSFDLTVLPHDALRQAPLSSVDEKPMKRASAAQLRQLLAEEDIAGYELDTARRWSAC